MTIRNRLTALERRIEAERGLPMARVLHDRVTVPLAREQGQQPPPPPADLAEALAALIDRLPN